MSWGREFRRGNLWDPPEMRLLQVFCSRTGGETRGWIQRTGGRGCLPSFLTGSDDAGEGCSPGWSFEHMLM